MIIVKSREEIKVTVLFSSKDYINLNREQQFEKALSEGWIYNILRGRFRKEVKH